MALKEWISAARNPLTPPCSTMDVVHFVFVFSNHIHHTDVAMTSLQKQPRKIAALMDQRRKRVAITAAKVGMLPPHADNL